MIGKDESGLVEPWVNFESDMEEYSEDFGEALSAIGQEEISMEDARVFGAAFGVGVLVALVVKVLHHLFNRISGGGESVDLAKSTRNMEKDTDRLLSEQKKFYKDVSRRERDFQDAFRESTKGLGKALDEAMDDLKSEMSPEAGFTKIGTDHLKAHRNFSDAIKFLEKRHANRLMFMHEFVRDGLDELFLRHADKSTALIQKASEGVVDSLDQLEGFYKAVEEIQRKIKDNPESLGSDFNPGSDLAQRLFGSRSVSTDNVGEEILHELGLDTLLGEMINFTSARGESGEVSTQALREAVDKLRDTKPQREADLDDFVKHTKVIAKQHSLSTNLFSDSDQKKIKTALDKFERLKSKDFELDSELMKRAEVREFFQMSKKVADGAKAIWSITKWALGALSRHRRFVHSHTRFNHATLEDMKVTVKFLKEISKGDSELIEESQKKIKELEDFIKKNRDARVF